MQKPYESLTCDVEATIADDDEMHNLKWRFFANVANVIVLFALFISNLKCTHQIHEKCSSACMEAFGYDEA